MQQNQFRLGLRPRPRWGSLSVLPDPLAAFKGPTSKGKGRVEREKEGMRRDRERREGRERKGWRGREADPVSPCIFKFSSG